MKGRFETKKNRLLAGFNGFGLGEGGDFHHPDSYRDRCGEPNFD
jgi:hypothetical protein